MKGLNRFLVACVALSLLCVACQDDDAVIEEANVDTSGQISPEYLKLAAFGELLSVDEIISNVNVLHGGSASRSNISSLSISDTWKIAVKSGNSRTVATDSVSLHCVYDSERDISTIVCGNRLYPFSLAVIDGEFSQEDNSLGGVRDYFSRVPIYLAENKLKYDAEAVAELESQIVNSDYSDGVYSFVIQPGGSLPIQRLEYETEYSYSSVIGPLVTTNWGQLHPYNKTLDLVPNEDSSAYVLPPAGCVAVAIAQILAYHKSPATISARGLTWQGNWNEITRHSNAIFLTDEYQTEVADLMKVIGAGVYMDYNWDTSGATLSSAYSFITYTLEINSSPISEYSFPSVTQSLSNNRPVFVCGADMIADSGHAWVIDGSRTEKAKLYERIYRSKVETPSDPIVDSEWELISSVLQSEETTSQVYCNWGWGNRSNGFFESGVFNVSTYHFNDNLYTICNINPN